MSLVSRGVRFGLVLPTLTAVALLGGCKKPIAEAPPAPDYSRELPPGQFGLRKLDPSQWPDVAPAMQQLDDPAFRAALERSIRWYGARSSQQFFPTGPISHPHAQASAFAIKAIGDETGNTAEALAQFRENFDVWESVGWDGSGDVLYTGYFSPVFTASRTPNEQYRFPLYKRPSDLQSNPNTGEVIGGYPSRAELEQSGKLQGLELVYLPSRLDAYIIEVNGSAKLNMTDGSVMYVGFAGTNGHDYTSIRKLLVQDGLLDENTAGLPAIRAYFNANPGQLEQYISQNARFVFFQPYQANNWPAGSMGFQVTPMRSLATDKTIFPRGSVVFTNTTMPTPSGVGGFNQLMLDQDTGGAIRAAGRADIYIGIGEQAETLAGRQAANGKLYYFLLKPERVQDWYNRMGQGGRTAVR